MTVDHQGHKIIDMAERAKQQHVSSHRNIMVAILQARLAPDNAEEVLDRLIQARKDSPLTKEQIETVVKLISDKEEYILSEGIELLIDKEQQDKNEFLQVEDPPTAAEQIAFLDLVIQKTQEGKLVWHPGSFQSSAYAFCILLAFQEFEEEFTLTCRAADNVLCDIFSSPETVSKFKELQKAIRQCFRNSQDKNSDKESLVLATNVLRKL